jgi:hypothetical protein
MGLEPTTFCMAKAGGRSRPFAPFAQGPRLQRFLRAERTGPNPSERRVQPCSHCDRCHVQLQWPVGANPPERPPLISASVTDQSSVGGDFPANPRDRIYEP